MKILFLGLAVSSLDNSQNLYSEMVLEFKNQGHQVTLVAPEYQNTRAGLHEENGVPVLRIKTLKLFNSGKFIKGFANLLLPYQYKLALKKSSLSLDFYLVIMPTPPITLISVANWLKKKYGSTVYLILRDIFPQNAIDLNIMKANSWAYRFFRKQEKKTYLVSDSIGCMSQGNISYVLKENPEMDPSKFHLLPNWGSERSLLGSGQLDEIRKTYGFNNKFVVIYGGNIGLPQQVENIIDLAEQCEDIDDILFVIIGDGTEKEKMINLINDKNISNVKFITRRLDTHEYFKVLQAADIGLISLNKNFTIPNIPSKALVYYNAKIPILASLDNNTDFHQILDESKAGLWAEAGNTGSLKEKLLFLYNNPAERKLMGKSGFDYFKRNLLTSDACRTIIKEVEKLRKND